MEKYFKSFGMLVNEDIQYLLSCFTIKEIQKNEYFVKEGEHCNEVAFIESGIFRSYYQADNGDDITYCFRFPNELMAAYSSFITGKPSVESLQAITPATIFVIRKEKLDKITAGNINWMKFLKEIAEQQYLELEKRMFQFQKEQAAQRYKNLLFEHPDYIRLIPLQYLASYLGITQRHFSRIRKELSY